MPRPSKRKASIRVRPETELLEKIKEEKDEGEEGREEEYQPQSPDRNEYTCAICGETFYKLDILAAHVKIAHIVESDILCEICNENFPSLQDRDMHICSRAFSTELFPYMKCIDCGKCYQITENSEHECFKKPDEEEILSFSTNFLNVSASSIDAHSLVQAVYNNPSANFNCHVPIRRMRERKPRNKNRLGHCDYVENFEGVECEKCGKVLRSHASLAVHKRTHSKNGKYECQYCGKRFPIPEYYTRHLRVHTKEKPFKCKVCEKAFSQPNTLTIHNRIHTGEKPYQCNICQKTFRVQDYLNKHMRSHTGEKPYQCDSCEKRFSQKSAFNLHRRALHFKGDDNKRTESIEQEI